MAVVVRILRRVSCLRFMRMQVKVLGPFGMMMYVEVRTTGPDRTQDVESQHYNHGAHHKFKHGLDPA